MQARNATPADAAAIARIYNQGIADRLATFETSPRQAADIVGWFDAVHPVVVVEAEGEVVAWDWRGRGAGRLAMAALIAAGEEAGFWKLVSRVFVENTASRALLRAVGFREVGVYEKHGRLDGAWRDVVIVERLIPANVR
jgi:phosphinothricin acetyltransferase